MRVETGELNPEQQVNGDSIHDIGDDNSDNNNGGFERGVKKSIAVTFLNLRERKHVPISTNLEYIKVP